jgi:methylmalonyl-CoA mutase cobalamin-binding domain/chain
MKDLNIQIRQALDTQRRALSERLVARQYESQAEIWKPYGSIGWEKSVRDAGYHLSYLAEAILAGDPALFVDYVGWVKVLFAGLNFPDDVLLTTLECTRDVLQEDLSEEMASVTSEYLEVALRHLSRAPSSVPTFIDPSSALYDLAQGYLEALLRAERHVASRLVLDAVERGVSIREIYLNVFQSAQYEIGRLWQMNEISVAQEHYCTAATQLIMSQLYSHIFSTERVGRRLVAACVGGELHEVGVRMVADFFEMEGWDTYYLGANAPAETILEAVAARRADVLGLSATMTFHVHLVTELIDRIRRSDAVPEVKILVGGYPFNTAPDLWRRVGADGFARNAQEAVTVANQLVV